MRVTIIIKGLIFVFAVLACLNIAMSLLVNRAMSDMTDAFEARYAFSRATYEFNTSAMLLTRYARVYASRSYAETGNNYHLYDFYWALRHYDTRIADAESIFRANNAQPEEMLMLLRAYGYSINLRALEERAFKAVARGEARYAVELMYGDDIKLYLNAISATLHDLDEILSERMQSSADAAHSRADFFNTAMVVFTVLFGLTSVGGTIWLLREVKTALWRESEASLISKREETLREVAEEESRAKTKFLARMSHEIRTPMNAVLGIAEIELMKSNHPRETEEAFMRIHSSSKLLLTVINDILDLSKVEAGKMEVLPAIYDVSRMVMDTVLLNLMHIGSKNIEFKLEINENLPVSLIGDESRIKQILNNFLSNAFKYTVAGTVTLSVGKSGATGDGKDITLIITISDTGQGMSPEEISKLFESEYARFNIEANRAVEGTGLGMNIARQLIEMMEGKISVKSSVGEGSEFIIKIPQKVSGNAVLGEEAAENLRSMKLASANNVSQHAIEPMPYAKVLAVDDIESNLYVVEGYLSPYQIQLETVSSGQEAIDKIKEGNVYDIVFMDHMMPEMDGLEATKIIREMGYKHPIIALTANTIKGAQELFLSNGFTGFIAKPIDVLQLHKQLIRHIRDKQPPEVREKAQAAAPAPVSNMSISAKITQSFLRDAARALETMQTAMARQSFDGDEMKTFAIQAHGMKSALGNIRRLEIANAAKILEDAANASDIETILAKTPDFINRVQAVVDELSAPAGTEDSPDSDPALLAEQLKIISDACDSYDKKTATRALKVLREQKWSQKTTGILNELEVKLLRAEFEEAVELIAK